MKSENRGRGFHKMYTVLSERGGGVQTILDP